MPINPLNATAADHTLLNALSSQHHGEQVFRKNTPYVVNGETVILTHTLVKYARKKAPGEYRMLVVNDHGKDRPDAEGSVSDVYVSNHTLKNGQTVLKNPQKERVIKFQSMEKLRNTPKSLGFARQGSRCAESLEWLHHKPAIETTEDSVTDVRVEIERRLPGMELFAFYHTPAFEALTIEQRFTLSINLLTALRDQVTEKNILHRDIKPENIFVDPETLEVFLIDFGYARPLDVNDGGNCGSALWAAPELFREEPLSDRTDLFSMARVTGFVWDNREKPPTEVDGDTCYQRAVNIPTDTLFSKPTTAALADPVKIGLRNLYSDMTHEFPWYRPHVNDALMRLINLRTQYHGLKAEELASTLHPQINDLGKRGHTELAGALERLRVSLSDAAINGLTAVRKTRICEDLRALKEDSTMAENRGFGNFVAIAANIGILIAGLGVFGVIGLAATSETRGSFFWRPKTRSAELVESVESTIQPMNAIAAAG